MGHHLLNLRLNIFVVYYSGVLWKKKFEGKTVIKNTNLQK